MNGLTYFVCSIFWISWRILEAILPTFFPTIPIKLESSAPRRQEVTKQLTIWPQPRTEAGSPRTKRPFEQVKGLRTSIQSTGVAWLKFKNRIFTIESRRECSARNQETGAGGSKPNMKWWRLIFSLHKVNKVAALSPELKYMEYTNHQYMSKIFSVCGWSWESPQLTHSQWKYTRQCIALCECFMILSMTAAIHLGSKSEFYKNKKFEVKESVFNITRKLVMEHSEEIPNVKCLEYSSPSWARRVFSHEQATSWARSKKYVSTLIPFCMLDRWQTLQER